MTDLMEASGIEVSRTSVFNWRATARTWTPEERVFDVSFTVYFTLNAHKDLIRDGMTVHEAQAAVNVARRYATNGTEALTTIITSQAQYHQNRQTRLVNGELLNRAVNAIGGGLDHIRTIIEEGAELNDKGRENLARALGYGQELAIILEDYALEPEMELVAA